MTRSQLLAALIMVAISTGAMAAPAANVIINASNAPTVSVKAKKPAKKVEQKKEEAPVAYKKPTRKKVVKK